MHASDTNREIKHSKTLSLSHPSPSPRSPFHPNPMGWVWLDHIHGGRKAVVIMIAVAGIMLGMRAIIVIARCLTRRQQRRDVSPDQISFNIHNFLSI